VLGKPYLLACRLEPNVEIDLKAIIAGRDFAGGVRCHSRNGGGVALYLFATVGRNRAGEPAGVVFVGRDVTGLWRAEEAAQVTADKYRVLFSRTRSTRWRLPTATGRCRRPIPRACDCMDIPPTMSRE